MKRDVDETKKKILEAVGTLLGKKGFQEIGINSIAREAGIGKVLIYRYFGGLEELLKAYGQQSNFWAKTEELLNTEISELEDIDLIDIGTQYLKSHLKEFRKRPTTQEIMRWELTQNNALTKELYNIRESLGIEFVHLLSERFQKEVPNMDVPAIMGIIHAGISYLVLLSKNVNQYAGIDLHSEDGWGKIENAIEAMIKIIISYYQTSNDSIKY